MSDQSDVDSDLAREEVAEEGDKPLGMGLNGVPPGIVEVTTVKPGTWAERKRILPGDLLLSINGEDFEEMSRERFKELLTLRPLRFLIDPPDTPSGSEGEEEKKARNERLQFFKKARSERLQMFKQQAKMRALLKAKDENASPQDGENERKEQNAPSDLKEKRHTLRHERRETRKSMKAGGESVIQAQLQEQGKAKESEEMAKERESGERLVDVKEKRHTLRHDRRETRKSIKAARQSVIQAQLQEEEEVKEKDPPESMEKDSKDIDQVSVHSDLAREVIAQEEDRPLGMGFQGLPPGILEVTSVKPGTWAERQQIHVGDFIVAVNDEDLDDMPKDRFKELFGQRPLRVIIDPPDTPEGSEDEQERLERDKKQREDAKEKARLAREEEAEKKAVDKDAARKAEEKARLDREAEHHAEVQRNKMARFYTEEMEQQAAFLEEQEKRLEREQIRQEKKDKETKELEDYLREEIRSLKCDRTQQEKASEQELDEMESEIHNEVSMIDGLEGRLRAAQRYRMRHNIGENLGSHAVPDELQERLATEEAKVRELESMLKAEAGVLRSGGDVHEIISELKLEQKAYQAEQNTVRVSLRVQQKAVEQAVERQREKFQDVELRKGIEFNQMQGILRSEEAAMRGMMRRRRNDLEVAEMYQTESWEEESGVVMKAEKAAARGLTRMETQLQSRLLDVEQEADFVDKFIEREEKQLRERAEALDRKEVLVQARLDENRKSFKSQVNDQLEIDSLKLAMAKDRTEAEELQKNLVTQEAEADARSTAVLTEERHEAQVAAEAQHRAMGWQAEVTALKQKLAAEEAVLSRTGSTLLTEQQEAAQVPLADGLQLAPEAISSSAGSTSARGAQPAPNQTAAAHLAVPSFAEPKRASGTNQALRRSHGPVYFEEKQEPAPALRRTHGPVYFEEAQERFNVRGKGSVEKMREQVARLEAAEVAAAPSSESASSDSWVLGEVAPFPQ